MPKLTYPNVDYGPLAALVGTWTGNKGMDVAPEPDGTENNPYTETIVFTDAGDLSNAESQKIAMVRYQQVVKRISNGEVFHDQTGYWMWDAERKLVMHSLLIPRGMGLLAGGTATAKGAGFHFHVEAKEGGEWGIVQSPFLSAQARTVSFVADFIVDGNRLEYSETTNLHIYGRDFPHTDVNVLQRMGD
jgi:methylamine---glutamate N-methyltransferase subunit C